MIRKIGAPLAPIHFAGFLLSPAGLGQKPTSHSGRNQVIPPQGLSNGVGKTPAGRQQLQRADAGDHRGEVEPPHHKEPDAGHGHRLPVQLLRAPGRSGT